MKNHYKESDNARLLLPGQFLGKPLREVQTPVGPIKFLGQQPHIDLHEHADTHLVFIAQGYYRTSARGADIIGPGSMLWNAPGTRHQDQFLTPGNLMTISLSEEFLHECDSWNCCKYAVQVRQPEAIRLLAAIAREAGHYDESSSLVVESWSLELLAAMTTQQAVSPVPPIWLSRICELMEDSSALPHSVQTLAREADVHPVHLARVFRCFFDMSPGTYLRQIRIRKAMRFLLDTDLALCDIALECGYSDQAAFTKVFLRMTATTPGQFRAHRRH